MVPLKEERELIARARRGDADAVAALIEAFQGPLLAFMLRMSGRRDVAEDVVQEAFVRVLRNLDRFDDRYRFSTWLFTIAKRLHVNAMQKHRPAYDTEAVGRREGPSSEPGHGSARRETIDNARAAIDEALECLSERQREIVVLFHQLDWSIQEISDHLVMPEGTVKSHLHRARARMRRCIVASGRRYEQVQEVWT